MTTVEDRPMLRVSVDEIEQDLVALLQRVQDGQTLVVIQAGKPIAEIKPIHTTPRLRPFGLCAGEFIVPDDFDDPLPEEVIQEFEGR
jgi:antitoxin (DNA-binding transcriptional repressor) of toxin-antitoxin stability system